MKPQRIRKFKIIFTLIISLILLNPSRGISALPVKSVLFHIEQISDTFKVPVKATTEEKHLSDINKNHLTILQKVKLLKQLHKYKNQKSGNTHYGLTSFILGFAPYLLFGIAEIAGAFLTVSGVFIVLTLGFLSFLAAVIFGIKGLRSDKQNGFAIFGLIFGSLGLLGYLLLILLAFLIQPL